MRRVAFVLACFLAVCLSIGCRSEQQRLSSLEQDVTEHATASALQQDADTGAQEADAFSMDAYLEELFKDSFMKQEIDPYIKELLYDWNGEVVYSSGGLPAYVSRAKNLHLLEEWLEHYRSGEAGKVALLQDGTFEAHTLYIVESDGSAQYSVSQYKVAGGYMMADGERSETVESEQHWQSTGVLSRTLDYIISPERDEPFPLFQVDYSAEPLEWQDGMELGSITPVQAEEISRSIGSKGTSNDRPVYNLTVGAERIRGLECYVLDGFVEVDGEDVFSGGSTEAITTDGMVHFIYDQANGGWILEGDDSAERIVPESKSIVAGNR